MGNNSSDANLIFSETGGCRFLAPTKQEVEYKIRRTRSEYNVMKRKYANNPRLIKIFDKKLHELQIIETKMVEAWTTSIDRETRDMLFRHLDWTSNDMMLLYGDDVLNHAYTSDKFNYIKERFQEGTINEEDEDNEDTVATEEEEGGNDGKGSGGGLEEYILRLPEAPVKPIRIDYSHDDTMNNNNNNRVYTML